MKEGIHGQLDEELKDIVFNMITHKNSEKFFFYTQGQDELDVYLQNKEFSLINAANNNHYTCIQFFDYIHFDEK